MLFRDECIVNSLLGSDSLLAAVRLQGAEELQNSNLLAVDLWPPINAPSHEIKRCKT